MPIVTEATSYGYRSTNFEPVTLADLRSWFEEVKRILAGRAWFGQLIDVRNRDLLPMRPDQDEIIQEAQRYVLSHGLVRSAVVVCNRTVALKIKELSFGTAVYAWERYIDGSDPQWERLALDWLEDGIDPDSGAPAEPAHRRPA